MIRIRRLPKRRFRRTLDEVEYEPACRSVTGWRTITTAPVFDPEKVVGTGDAWAMIHAADAGWDGAQGAWDPRSPRDGGDGMESGDLSARFTVEGEVIVATGKVDDALVSKVLRSSRPLLILNRALGFDEVDCAVLQQVGDRLVGLEVVGDFTDDSDVLRCSKLEELNLNTSCRGGLDWGRLPDLIRLFTYEERMSESLASLHRLTTLHIHRASDDQVALASSLPRLTDLTLSSTRMRAVSSLAGYGDRLTRLWIRQGSALRGFDDLSRLSLLRTLLLDSCRHLDDLGFVSGMPDLEVLAVSDCGGIESLRPLAQLSRLREVHLVGSTNVKDGDLSVLEQLPSLRGAYFQKRRHYRGAPARFPTRDD